MRIKDIHTGEEKDLLDDVAKRWVSSCSPWYSDEGAAQGDTADVTVQEAYPTKHDLERIDPDSIHQFWNYCLSCTRSVMCARTIGEIFKERNASNNIWIQVKNNSYAVAVMEWSKGFGSNSEEYHWKKVFGDDSRFIHQLHDEIGLSEEDYQEYWQAMQDARVSWIAHTGLPKNPEPKLPDFDLAIELFAATHKILVRALKGLTELHLPKVYLLEPMSFEVWMDNLKADLKKEIEPAVVTSLKAG